MTESVTTAPPNSLILICDRGSGEIPEPMGSALVATTSTCLAVGTLSESDGETTLRLSRRGVQLDRTSLKKVWIANLAVPSGVLTVSDVLGKNLLSLNVPSEVSVQVWANDESEPDLLEIIVD